MCSLCRLPVAKNHNFGQFLTFGGLLYRPPFTDEGFKFGVLEQTEGLHLHAKFHLNVLIESASGDKKSPQFWANFDYRGLLNRPPFTYQGQIWHAIADPLYTLTY